MAFVPRTIQKMVLIVRTDLGMSQGKIAAQCAHAALECYIKGCHSFMKYFATKGWLIMGQPKIVLKVCSEKELIAIADKAEKAGLVTVTIRDAGRTQLMSGTITVLGIGPAKSERIDEITSHLKLL